MAAPLLPEHSAVIIDEAHELVSRVTGAASAELSPQMVERVARRALPYLEDEVALELLESADDTSASRWTVQLWNASRTRTLHSWPPASRYATPPGPR